MFKKYSLILAGVLALSSLHVGANVLADKSDNFDITVKYYSPEDKLILQGRTDNPGENVIIRILPFEDGKSFSDDKMISGDAVVKVMQADLSGNLDVCIVLPKSFLGKKYSYSISGLSGKTQGSFTALDTEKLTSIIEKINSGDMDEIKSVLINDMTQTGLDNGDKEKDYSYMAEAIKKFRPSGGYSEEDFTDVYFICEGLSYINSKKITADKFFTDYAAYMKSDYVNKYKSASAKTQQFIDEKMKSIELQSSFDETVGEMFFISDLRESGSYSHIMSKIVDKAKADEVSLTNYGKLSNDYYKEKVFKEIYDNIENYSSAKDIFDDVESRSKKLLNEKSNNSSSKGGGGGGSSQNKNFSVKTVPTRTGTDVAQTDEVRKLFNDIDGHWAYENILNAQKSGVIDGFEDGSFRPDKEITRAEFVKIVVKMKNLKLTDNNYFNDVSSDAWYCPYISAAFENGIVLGSSDNFYPSDNITREDACVILYRAFYKDEVNESAKIAFDDFEDISDYANNAVTVLSSGGIIKGYDNKFSPKENITRAEVSAVADRITDKK